MKVNNLRIALIGSVLIFCYILYTMLSWILLFRDPRALIGITNLYPSVKTSLFSLQTTLMHFGLNSIPTIVFALITIVAVIAYIYSLKQKISLRKTIIFALVFQCITFISYPILSTDIFSYIMSERVSTVHHENIWKVKPEAFPNDQFAVLADWKDTTSVYGALHYLLYLVPSLIGNNDLVALVILYKFIPTLFVFGTMFVFYKLLSLYKIKNKEALFRFIFWNPLVVLELIGSAHNDSMMLFFAISGWYLFARKKWLGAGILLAFAMQIKLIPIVLFVYCLLTLVRTKRFTQSLIFLSGFLATNALAFSFMQVNVLEFMQRVLYNGGVYWQSLQTLLQTFLPGKSSFVVYLFLLWGIYYTYLYFRKNNSPIKAYITIILIYLIFVSAAYWNWYILWIFLFIPFTDKRTSLSAFALTITSLFAYPLLWTIQRINTPSVLWPILTYCFIFGLPIIGYILGFLRKDWFDKLLGWTGLDQLIEEKVSNSV